MISKIKLQNWKTHSNSELDFTQGVNALVGIIGSGKSSVLDAICFALFGTFPALQQRRIKLDNVIMRYPHKKTSALVELELNREGKKYTITRKIESGKGTVYSEIKEDGKSLESPNTQRVTEIIERILKIDHDLFSQIIYSEQNRMDYFLQIPRGNRMKKIDELLKINKFEKARENTVTLINRLKQRKILKSEDLSRLEGQLKDEDVEKVKEKVEEINKQISDILEEINSLGKNREKLDKIVIGLKESKEKFDSLNEKKTTLNGRIAQINDGLSKIENIDELEKIDPESTETRIKELNDELENQRIMEKEFIKIGQEERLSQKQLNELEDKIKELKKNKEKYDELENIEQELEKNEKELNEVSEKITSLSTKLDEDNKNLDELKKVRLKCPLCETSISKDKHGMLIGKKQQTINKLKEEISSVQKNKMKFREKVDYLKDNYRELASYSSIDADLKESMSKQENSEKFIKELNNKLRDIKDRYSEDKLRDIEKELKNLDRIKESLAYLKNKNELEDELKKLTNDLNNLDFKEEELEGNIEELQEISKKIDVLKEKENSSNLLLDEIKIKLETFEKQKDFIDEYKEEIKKLEWTDKELNKFKLVLEKTQISLREEFIGSINYTMSDIWKSLYPYEDYVDIRLHIDDDYTLQLQSVDGDWVNVEGIVSGGERTTAILTLRLAFAMILAPNIKWLVLDEPTHNLDRRAVEELAQTFRSKISGLIDQVFLITHDESLEGAVTGKLYRLERAEGKREETKIVEID